MTIADDETVEKIKGAALESVRLLEIRLGRSAIPEDATEYGEILGQKRQTLALIARLEASQAEVKHLREVLTETERVVVEAAIPLEAIIFSGKGAHSLAIWEGAVAATQIVRAWLDRRVALSPPSPDRAISTAEDAP